MTDDIRQRAREVIARVMRDLSLIASMPETLAHLQDACPFRGYGSDVLVIWQEEVNLALRKFRTGPLPPEPPELPEPEEAGLVERTLFD